MVRFSCSGLWAFDDATGENAFLLLDVKVGDLVDFVLGPKANDGADGTTFTATILRAPASGTEITQSAAKFSGTQGLNGSSYSYLPLKDSVSQFAATSGTATRCQCPH